jgi:hypothetical protein
MVEDYDDYDPNEGFEEKLEVWLEEKNFLERLFNQKGGIIKLVDDINNYKEEEFSYEVAEDMLNGSVEDLMMGDEVIIDEHPEA